MLLNLTAAQNDMTLIACGHNISKHNVIAEPRSAMRAAEKYRRTVIGTLWHEDLYFKLWSRLTGRDHSSRLMARQILVDGVGHNGAGRSKQSDLSPVCQEKISSYNNLRVYLYDLHYRML